MFNNELIHTPIIRLIDFLTKEDKRGDMLISECLMSRNRQSETKLMEISGLKREQNILNPACL